MSGTVGLTIGGAWDGVHGTVTIPSSLLFGATATTPGSINAMIQSYLAKTVSTDLGKGTADFSNNDLAAGTVYTLAGSGGASFEEFTNISTSGASVTGTGSYSASVTSGVTDLAVQVPGNVTLSGVASTTTLLFGAASNVDYAVTNPGAGTMYLAGGANSVTLYSAGTPNAETIYSAGSDTIDLQGSGTDYVSVYGNAVIKDLGAAANVVAEGSATTNLYWDGGLSGGSLNFVNNSSVAATIHIGIFGSVQAPTHVTAYGGAGGGFFVGGTSGANSLIGGSGVVTLVGAGNGDFLEAQSSIGTNLLFSGAGTETLVATSTTGSNVFDVGLNYVGLGQPQAQGMVSTDGSGVQQFFTGNVAAGETLYGSTATGAQNQYSIVSDATAGGGTYSIYNFIDGRSAIFLVSGDATSAGSATITGMGADQFRAGQYDIALSDGTTILLKGLTSAEMSSIHTATGASGIIQIQG